MSSSLGLTPEIVAYLARVNPPEHPVLARCRSETMAQLGRASRMQISPEQGHFMALLARLIGARRAVEVGVFTGYSALSVTLAMREMHGEAAYLLACDVSEEWTSRARAYWAEAGVATSIDLQVRPALETLDARLAAGEAGAFDLAFIDADKTNYPGYYERCLSLLRPGGLMLFDNVLWSGAVADPADVDPDTQALRAVAAHAAGDARVEAVMTSIGDGLLFCRKR
jgi:caffeoyl-CoA O-methyltransferase